MVIDSLMQDPGPSIYYNDAFRVVLEDHIAYLKTHPGTTVIYPDSMQRHRYEFDLFGLLTQHNIPAYLHWIIMRLNRLSSPNIKLDDINLLLIPDPSIIEQIRQSHVAITTIN